MQDRLTELAILYGTDKFGHHDYTPNYYKLFKHLQDAPIKLLEIGVGGYADVDRGGQSLEVWRDFFPNAEITGIDIQEKCMDLGPRVKILQGSQVDPDFLAKLVAERGPFNIIVDDGSHRNEHIVESCKLLFPTLNHGGIYVVEDVQTSFHPRFGGSLSLDEPNSIGYFGWLMQQLNTASADPLIREVSAMERFHNMIALHKRAEDGTGLDVFESNCFEIFEGKYPNIIHLGNCKYLERLPITAGDIDEAPLSTTRVKDRDIVVCYLTENETLTPDRLEDLLRSLNQEGILVVFSEAADRDFSPDSSLMSSAMKRFKLIDHVEIRVHFSNAEIDDLAENIYSMERYKDSFLFHKAPNTYPSNFAFDASNHQASSALDHMADVLQNATTEGGLVQYADLLTRYRSRGDARDVLRKLEELGARSRRFYQMAGALAQRDREIDRAEMLYSTALERFPDDAQFSVSLSSVFISRRDFPKAERILRNALEYNPRARAVVAALSRLLAIRGEMDEAIDLARQSINLFPKSLRATRMVNLAQLLRTNGQLDEAEEVLKKVENMNPDHKEIAKSRDPL